MILDEIVAYKRQFVEHRKRVAPLAELKARSLDMPAPPAFREALRRAPGADVNVIAEVKKASPSKGVIREDFNAVRIAADYAEHGAAAISILTDEQFFQGSLDYLREARAEIVATPLLRKDFTIDEYQVYEARAAGAAAILLITGILDKFQLTGFRQLAEELGMDALTEVHLEAEADRAAEHGARLIGVNNRDLRDFSIDIRQTERIIKLLAGAGDEFTFVAESGISTPDDVDYFRHVGVDALLVGESLMRQPSPGKALEKLLGRDEESMERRAEDEELARRLGPDALGDRRRALLGED